MSVNCPAVQGSDMKDMFKQFSGILGSLFAAACCLGLPVVLSATAALGLGFIINDAYLMPLFAAFVLFTLWQLHGSARRHGDLRPFWLSALAGGLALVLMFGLVTGFYPQVELIAVTLTLFVAGSIWDFINGRRRGGCGAQISAVENSSINPGRRKLNGAALAVASAGVFYGLYKSVDTLAPSKKDSQIKCWGANSCKGTTACGSALNSCTGQNSCKGKGWAFLSHKECQARGGVPFEGSPGDPNHS